MQMGKQDILLAGGTRACRYAGTFLRASGLTVADTPGADVGYVLLDVPSFGNNGILREGGCIGALLEELPKNVTVCGGNLSHPALKGYNTVDFLKDEIYLCGNAYITAECALDVALPYLRRTIRGCPVLVVGWGRIGKCLGQLLKNLGADVTIAVRNQSQQAILQALGYHAVNIENLPKSLSHFRLLYNTVPCPILSREQMFQCREDCVKIELASKDGMEGDDIIIARGLPGIHLPESSGELIAETFLRLCCGR
jgi:dipicolinate synthase subunit A